MIDPYHPLVDPRLFVQCAECPNNGCEERCQLERDECTFPNCACMPIGVDDERRCRFDTEIAQ